MTDTSASIIATLSDTQAGLDLLGGKGASLARLAQAGFPIPAGFVVTTAAYKQFVADPSLWKKIADEITQAYAALPGNSPAVAVRSSATTEDLAGASFAGQQETYLNICGREAVLEAVQKCWASLWTARSVAYRTRLGIPVDGTAMAFVVQLMVSADAAGVLFTANPVTGNPDQVVINAVWGFGEALVSGLVNPDTILIAKSSGFIIERVTAEKKLMTMPAGGGTQVQPVPPDMQQTPVLSDPQAAQLAKLGKDVENLYQTPVDIEWALSSGEFVLLQARPITALPVYSSEADPFSWNDSLQGEALWSNVNFGEAMTEVMTPLTCSVVSQFTLKDWQYIPGYSIVGNIGGYLYLNISVFASLYRVLGKSRQDFLDEMEATLYMQLPETMQIPTLPLTRRQMLSSLLASAKVQCRQALGVRKTRAYIEANPGWFQDIVHRIQAAENEQELLACFQQHIQKHVLDGVWCVMGSATHSANYTLNLRRDLEKMVGAEDAGILIANVSGDNETLLSLEPVLGLSRIARGEMTKEHYLEEYGHRGPDEFELSKPRPAEDPHWLDRQLELYNNSPVDVIALIQKQRAAFIDAFSRLLSGFPRQSKSFQRRIEKSVQKARLREEARSAYVRDRWSLRLFALRAAELSGLGQDIFYLTLDEILGLLGGNRSALRFIPSRKAAYSRFKTLSPFPSIILGPYDPFEKASEPAGWLGEMDGSKIIKGSPASAGQVEGVVRILTRPDEWREGQQGEILCAYQTDIAWTLIFPYFAGIITDVGAPLSHSAIVARELGIPAVVGCGNATRRLKTGDRVRLDGGRGIVEVIAD